jgi:hypothetical protein
VLCHLLERCLEVSFVEEIKSLRLGEGDTFHGEGILAVTKALLQSGVAYVGGYQGAPVSHLLDVMVQAKPLMQELGVHVEACANEASAAAMLGASIHYPLRGAVTWKSGPHHGDVFDFGLFDGRHGHDYSDCAHHFPRHCATGL